MRRRIALLGLLVWVAAAPALLAQGATTTFTHDANGNLTSKTENGVVWTYVYDARNLLREVQRDGLLFESYQYDYQGHRIKKVGPDGIVRYVWGGNKIILETDDHGNTIAKYEYARDRLLSVHHATEGTGFYLLDTLGTPVALSRPDGSLAARYKLDAWGVLRSEVGDFSNPFRFTGHLFDEATGLYYAKARYYNPETGRFLTEDPVKGDIFEPATLNPYTYASANPTVYVDPDGRCVGKLQQTPFCQAIAEGLSVAIAGDPVAAAEREIERREKVVQGRREFRAETGREPAPGEVVWSQGSRALTSDFREIDMSGRIEPDHAEWAVVGAGVSTRLAVSGARAAGASTAEQVVAGVTQLGDEAIGQVTGVSPGDVAGVTRLAKQGLAPRPPPSAAAPKHVTIGESSSRPGVELHSSQPSSVAPGAETTEPPLGHPELPPLQPGRTPFQEFDIDRYGTFAASTRTGDDLAGHEMLQNVWLREHGFIDSRGAGVASRNNPAVALSKDLHDRIGLEQRRLGLFDRSKVSRMTAEENIALNAQAMRNAGVPEPVIQVLQEEASKHAVGLSQRP